MGVRRPGKGKMEHEFLLMPLLPCLTNGRNIVQHCSVAGAGKCWVYGTLLSSFYITLRFEGELSLAVFCFLLSSFLSCLFSVMVLFIWLLLAVLRIPGTAGYGMGAWIGAGHLSGYSFRVEVMFVVSVALSCPWYCKTRQ